MRRIRTIHFCPWAAQLEATEVFLGRIPSLNISGHVSDPSSEKLLKMARLDCDWHAENARAFGVMQHPSLSFLPSFVSGKEGLASLLSRRAPIDEETWVIFAAQHPQKLETLAPKVFRALRALGYRIFYYSYDEASRAMAVYKEIAPTLSALVHDESPLEPTAEALLPKNCFRRHYSWVANLVPFAVPFNEAPEEKIIFLGSEMGLTDNRRRQLEHLSAHFKDRFEFSCDHSVSVADKSKLSRFKASLCPEGRMFGTPAMSRTHTDRPFWSGCLGMVPISENSKQGGRLDDLATRELLCRYEHADLKTLVEACEKALAATTEQRKRIYDHYNSQETVGKVVADAIAACPLV